MTHVYLGPSHSLWTRFCCWLVGHDTQVAGNDTHQWGECMRCRRRYGIVSREALRRLADARAREKEFQAERKKIEREILGRIL